MFAAVASSTTKDIDDLYRRLGHLVLRRASQIVGNQDEAEEVLQEVFGKLLEQPHMLAGIRNERAWLYSTTTNLCLNRLRNQKNRARLLREKVAPVVPTTDSTETRLVIRRAIEALPVRLAEVLVYYYFDEMTQEEISLVVGCSRRHVGNLLARAHTQMKKEIDPDREVAE